MIDIESLLKVLDEESKQSYKRGSKKDVDLQTGRYYEGMCVGLEFAIRKIREMIT